MIFNNSLMAVDLFNNGIQIAYINHSENNENNCNIIIDSIHDETIRCNRCAGPTEAYYIILCRKCHPYYNIVNTKYSTKYSSKNNKLLYIGKDKDNLTLWKQPHNIYNNECIYHDYYSDSNEIFYDYDYWISIRERFINDNSIDIYKRCLSNSILEYTLDKIFYENRVRGAITNDARKNLANRLKVSCDVKEHIYYKTLYGQLSDEFRKELYNVSNQIRKKRIYKKSVILDKKMNVRLGIDILQLIFSFL